MGKKQKTNEMPDDTGIDGECEKHNLRWWNGEIECPVCEAEDMLETAKEVLKPFAACAEVWTGADEKYIIHFSRRGFKSAPDLFITVGDLLKAATALAKLEAK
jgi:hypothetical protein